MSDYLEDGQLLSGRGVGVAGREVGGDGVLGHRDEEGARLVGVLWWNRCELLPWFKQLQEEVFVYIFEEFPLLFEKHGSYSIGVTAGGTLSKCVQNLHSRLPPC